MHNKGDKDSAYHLLKDNLKKTDIQNVCDSYYFTLGEMFYKDNIYDSAIYYPKKSIESDCYYISFASAKTLYALYDSINDIGNKNYYGDFYFDLTEEEINNSVKRNSLQRLYNEHIERRLLDREIRQKKFYTFVVLPIITTLIIIFIYLFIKYRKRGNSLRMQLLDEKDNIKKKDSIIDNLRFNSP